MQALRVQQVRVIPTVIDVVNFNKVCPYLKKIVHINKVVQKLLYKSNIYCKE